MKEIEALRVFFTELEKFTQIYGDHDDARIRKVEMVLASVGAVDRESPWYSSFLKTTIGLDPNDKGDNISHYVAGEIGSVFLPLESGDKRIRERLQEVESRWVAGPKLSDLQKLALDSPKKGNPGVVVVAHGESKADVLFAAIQLGCVNEIIIDVPLAKQIERKADMVLR